MNQVTCRRSVGVEVIIVRIGPASAAACAGARVQFGPLRRPGAWTSSHDLCDLEWGKARRDAPNAGWVDNDWAGIGLSAQARDLTPTSGGLSGFLRSDVSGGVLRPHQPMPGSRPSLGGRVVAFLQAAAGPPRRTPQPPLASASRAWRGRGPLAPRALPALLAPTPRSHPEDRNGDAHQLLPVSLEESAGIAVPPSRVD